MFQANQIVYYSMVAFLETIYMLLFFNKESLTLIIYNSLKLLVKKSNYTIYYYLLQQGFHNVLLYI